jgi:hypothetical protein
MRTKRPLPPSRLVALVGAVIGVMGVVAIAVSIVGGGK